MRSRMEAKDDSFGFDLEGVYSEIIKLKKMVYNMLDGRAFHSDFESIGNEIIMRTPFDAETQYPIEVQKVGCQAILNNFKNYVESEKFNNNS